MPATKRPQNKCKSCSYTWYPRGKSLSNNCPNCGSTQVSTVVPWSGLAILFFAGYAIWGSNNNDKPTDMEASASTPYIANQPAETTVASDTELLPSTQKNDASEQAEQPNSSAFEEATPTVETKLPSTKQDAPEQAEHPNGVTLEAATSAAETKSTPSSICEHEGNFFSRNNCKWKECEKSEFSELEECAIKKPKDKVFGH